MSYDSSNLSYLVLFYKYYGAYHYVFLRIIVYYYVSLRIITYYYAFVFYYDVTNSSIYILTQLICHCINIMDPIVEKVRVRGTVILDPGFCYIRSGVLSGVRCITGGVQG